MSRIRVIMTEVKLKKKGDELNFDSRCLDLKVTYKPDKIGPKVKIKERINFLNL